jgi:hypothetical protein
VPGVLFCGLSGPRLRNLSDASAKSNTAPKMLLSCAAPFDLPSLPCSPPPSISEILLNALPIFLRSMFRRSFNLGQSTSTWPTVPLAPHSHLSFSGGHVACHESPAMSGRFEVVQVSRPGSAEANHTSATCGWRVESHQSGGGAPLS